jgi:hypothetical protein
MISEYFADARRRGISLPRPIQIKDVVNTFEFVPNNGITGKSTRRTESKNSSNEALKDCKVIIERIQKTCDEVLRPETETEVKESKPRRLAAIEAERCIKVQK